MFSKESLEISDKLERNWSKKCAEMYGGLDPKATTYSGISAKPVYGPQDLHSSSVGEIGMPGEYPYTRGVYPLQYQYQPLMAQQGFGFGLPELARERYEYLRSQGMTGYVGMEAPYNVSGDIPAINGLDPDDPEAKGYVGWAGCPMSTLEDFAALYDGLPLEKTHLAFFGFCDPSPVVMALLCAYLDKRGIPLDKMNGNIVNSFTTQYVGYDNLHFPPESALKLSVDLVKFCSEYMPKWGTLNLHGYNLGESGATAVQEIAFCITAAIDVARSCVGVGLSPDLFVPRFSVQAWGGRDFFETIAKLRAFRRVWAKIFSERFGCTNPRALQLRIFVQTAGSGMTAQQPLNNLMRATLYTLSAVLGGAQAAWTTTYDECLSLPSEEAQMLAMRTRQVIMEESNVGHVVDPLGGSYYIEWLTSKLEEEAIKLIDEIERKGGYKKCALGWLKSEVDRSYGEWKQKVEKGEEVLVGVNKYVVPEEPREVEFRMDPRWEAIAIDRIKAFKARRDNRSVEKALDDLRMVSDKVNKDWPHGGDLMPTLINTAKANATLGEMMKVLKEVFGYQYCY